MSIVILVCFVLTLVFTAFNLAVLIIAQIQSDRAQGQQCGTCKWFFANKEHNQGMCKRMGMYTYKGWSACSGWRKKKCK